MNVVLADVQADALERAAAEMRGLGAEVLPFRLDVSQAHEVEALGAATAARASARRTSSSTTPASAPAA